jgi:hypothetical protein
LILHLVYGATLGTVYGPLGDIPADEFPSRGQVDAPGVVSHYEGNAAKGIVVGAALGGVVGIAGSLLAGTNVLPLGISPLAFLPVTVVLGASFGALIGSIAGLAPGTNR